MQIYFTVEEGVEKYVEMGRDYPFPPPPTLVCHHCKRLTEFKKHGFYKRFIITISIKDKVYIRRYICPHCKHTVSYLPSFCLTRFIYGIEYIFDYIYQAFNTTDSLKACLDKLNATYKGLNISRQLLYHYKNRFMDNLKSIQTGLRQLVPRIKLPEDSLDKKERAKRLLFLIKETTVQAHSFSQRYYQQTNQALLSCT